MSRITSQTLRITAAVFALFLLAYYVLGPQLHLPSLPSEGADENAPEAQAVSEAVPETAERANATFVTLARNRDLWPLIESIRAIEDRFNHQFHYDWVFLNDDDFTPQFMEVTSALISGKTHYGKIPKEQWSVPSWVDRKKAEGAWKKMEADKVIYGGSESYRHMCRFESGFFFQHPLLDQFKYYWRIEPDVKFFCDIPYDVFKFMADNKLKYGFTTSMHEYVNTIETLWNTTSSFVKDHPEYLDEDNMMDFVSDDKGDTYNLCHFWSNFEIGDLDFWRSEAYQKFFEHLDKSGGFFYERWGDAPVHTIAASLFLNKAEIHHFDDIGYEHKPFKSCPTDPEIRKTRRCGCDPTKNFTWKKFSCTSEFYQVQGKTLPSESWISKKQQMQARLGP